MAAVPKWHEEGAIANQRGPHEGFPCRIHSPKVAGSRQYRKTQVPPGFSAYVYSSQLVRQSCRLRTVRSRPRRPQAHEVVGLFS